MKSKHRSLSGAALMLVIIPIFAGLLACMPVPIGDPERSRIDPDLTGVWAALGDEGTVDESGFYVLEPYDKRTWLVTGIPIKVGEESDLSKYDFSAYDGIAAMAATEPVDLQHVYTDDIVLYKAWLKKLGGGLFMTWEPKALLDDGLVEPDIWFVYRVIKDGPDRIRLRFVNSDSDLFDDVDKTRRAFEKVIKKHVNNPELYAQDTDVLVTLVRVQADELYFVEELLGSVVNWD